MKFSKLLKLISLIIVLIFGFIALTLSSISPSYWQKEYDKCLQRDYVLAANCINEKRQRWWQFDFLYKNGGIGNLEYDKSLKEEGLVK